MWYDISDAYMNNRAESKIFLSMWKPDVKPRKYFDGGGLFLFITANGSKLWRIT